MIKCLSFAEAAERTENLFSELSQKEHPGSSTPTQEFQNYCILRTKSKIAFNIDFSNINFLRSVTFYPRPCDNFPHPWAKSHNKDLDIFTLVNSLRRT